MKRLIFPTNNPSNRVNLVQVNCPQCNSIAWDFDDTQEETDTISCPYCGYEEKIDLAKQSSVIHKGYGYAHLEYQNQKPLDISFEDTAPSEDDINEVLKYFDDFFVIQEQSYFFLWNENTHSLTALRGNIPQSFDDYARAVIDEQNYYHQFN